MPGLQLIDLGRGELSRLEIEFESAMDGGLCVLLLESGQLIQEFRAADTEEVRAWLNAQELKLTEVER